MASQMYEWNIWLMMMYISWDCYENVLLCEIISPFIWFSKFNSQENEFILPL